MAYHVFLNFAIKAALNAGKEILKIYETNFSVEVKNDNTPVTIADKKASETIINTLRHLEIPIICEEEPLCDYLIRKDWERLWLVDPLDGTKEFVKRNGEFTVNIALIENNKPVVGVIYSPVFEEMYYAAKNTGSYKICQEKLIQEIDKNQINFIEGVLSNSEKLPNQLLPKKYTVVASRSHLNRDINEHLEKLKRTFGEVDMINVGSSIKQCWIAEGKAHEYLRLGTTMEWDTAAGQCIIEQSGGQITDLETNAPLLYNKPNMKNNFFIAKQKQ